MKVIDTNRLKELLSYDESTGYFTWIKSTSNRVPVGRVCNTPNSKAGYIQIRIDGTVYLSHRLVWLYIHGSMPDGQIDHIDHVKTNNLISNLRVVDNKTNSQNQSMNKANTSGYAGVYWNKEKKKWDAAIKINGKKKHIGRYTLIDDAIQARQSAIDELGYHQNHGR